MSNYKIALTLKWRLDCVSEIKRFADEVIVVEGGKYLRGNCVLKIRGSHLQLVK